MTLAIPSTRTIPASVPAAPLLLVSPLPASASPPRPGAASSAVQALPSKTWLFPLTYESLYSLRSPRRDRNSAFRKKHEYRNHQSHFRSNRLPFRSQGRPSERPHVQHTPLHSRDDTQHNI